METAPDVDDIGGPLGLFEGMSWFDCIGGSWCGFAMLDEEVGTVGNGAAARFQGFLGACFFTSSLLAHVSSVQPEELRLLLAKHRSLQLW